MTIWGDCRREGEEYEERGMNINYHDTTTEQWTSISMTRQFFLISNMSYQENVIWQENVHRIEDGCDDKGTGIWKAIHHTRDFFPHGIFFTKVPSPFKGLARFGETADRGTGGGLNGGGGGYTWATPTSTASTRTTPTSMWIGFGIVTVCYTVAFLCDSIWPIQHAI